MKKKEENNAHAEQRKSVLMACDYVVMLAL